jgi:Flp pilus assembly protein TadG
MGESFNIVDVIGIQMNIISKFIFIQSITKELSIMIGKKNEKGQALIIIVLGMVALIGLTALAVDGGNAYADRRNAQNAADTAALAAALGKINQPAGTSPATAWKDSGYSRATSNGYDNNGTSNIVHVYECDEANATCTLPAGTDPAQYIQVTITSTVNTYFASVVGVSQLTNNVRAISRASAGVISPMWGGSAVVGLNPSGCKAVTYQGSASVTLIGSGLYVNSNCPTAAFFNNSNSPGTALTAPCLQAVGGIQYASGSLNVPAGCIQTGVPPYTYPTLPNPSCGSQVAVKAGNILSPGSWTGAFPPNGVTILQPGLYCVHSGNFQINGGSELHGHGVIIYMIDGFVKWNGGALVDLQAPTSGPFKGLLLYLPPTNTNVVVVNGNGQSSIVGSILAPGSDVTVEGGGGSSGLQTQIIGNNVSLGGSSNTVIQYDASMQYQPPLEPVIELTQ